MRWTSHSILQALRDRHEAGRPVGYRALARENRSLVSAAAYHFGSFRIAVEKAGIDYLTVTSRPRWTKQKVISTIKDARRAGTDLSWAAVMASDTPLRRAAYVAVKRRMFGNWPRALEAAGVDSDAARRHQHWDKTVVLAELKQLHANGEPVTRSALLRTHAALHAVAVRYFGTLAAALRAARIPRARAKAKRRPKKR